MRLLALVGLVLVYGCGPECSLEDRTGTYLMSFNEVSGGCGPIDPEIARLDGSGTDPGPGCTLEYERVSEDQCSLERATSCQSSGLDIELEGVTNQEPGSEGDLLTGTAEVDVYDSGALVCSSIYQITARRQ